MTENQDFNLSEKMIIEVIIEEIGWPVGDPYKYFKLKDVREFIRRLKKTLLKINDKTVLTVKGVKKLMELEIDALAGDELK